MLLTGALVLALTASTGVAYAMMGGISKQTVSSAMYGPSQFRGVMDQQHYQDMLNRHNSVANSVYGKVTKPFGPKAGMGMGRKMMGNKTFGPRWNR